MRSQSSFGCENIGECPLLRVAILLQRLAIIVWILKSTAMSFMHTM